MSTFKTKSSKAKEIHQPLTLDETHRRIITGFQKRKNTLPDKRKKLSNLKYELEILNNLSSKDITDKDVHRKSKLKTEIISLEDEIYDIENNISEMEYYSSTSDTLISYYEIIEEETQYISDGEDEVICEIKKENQEEKVDMLDKLNMLSKKKKIKKPARIRKKKNNLPQIDILSLLNPNASVDNSQKNKKDKSMLYEKYMSIIDNTYLYNIKKRAGILIICEKCDIEKVLVQTEGYYVCMECGEAEMAVLELEKTNAKESSYDKPSGYAYKRINHFNELLCQFQAKESIDIPDEVFNGIVMEMHKKGEYDMSNLSISYVRKILKQLNVAKYYEHSTHIWSKLSGNEPPTINRDTEEILRKLFKQMQGPFEKHCPDDRVNFLSYSYVLHKLCQLLELDDFVKCFPLLKSRDKLKKQDEIWEKICNDLRWQFIPST